MMGMQFRFNKLTGTVEENRRKERMAAEVERQGALIEYVAIMADVELPDNTDQELPV